jgi:hypothetical protein
MKTDLYMQIVLFELMIIVLILLAIYMILN